MIPQHYLDFAIGDEERSRASGGLSAPVIAGAALKVLHGAFSKIPGRYALALPGHERQPFAILRIFTSEREHLDSLVEAVESHTIMRDYLRLGYPRKVPVGFAGGWTEFRRYRIPARRSGRNPDDNLRERRMRHAAEARLPYFIMQSRSNGQQFGLYVEICSGAPAITESQPDSYGFSVASRPFALPNLP